MSGPDRLTELQQAITDYFVSQRIASALQPPGMQPGTRLVLLRDANLMAQTRYVRRTPQADVAPALLTWLMALADNDDLRCTASLSRLARVLGRSRPSIGRAYARLIEVGVVRNDGKSTRTVTAPVLGATVPTPMRLLDALAPRDATCDGAVASACNAAVARPATKPLQFSRGHLQRSRTSLATEPHIDLQRSRSTSPLNDSPTDNPKMKMAPPTAAPSAPPPKPKKGQQEMFHADEIGDGRVLSNSSEFRWLCPEAGKVQAMKHNWLCRLAPAEPKDLLLRWAQEEISTQVARGKAGDLHGLLRTILNGGGFVRWKANIAAGKVAATAAAAPVHETLAERMKRQQKALGTYAGRD